MRKEFTLAVYAHQSRLEEMISFLKAHSLECSDWEIVGDCDMVKTIHDSTGIHCISFGSNHRDWTAQILEFMADHLVKGVIYLGDQTLALKDNPRLLRLLQSGLDQDVPVAINLSSGEALIHLLDEHPEALTGHHLAAQYLEDIAYRH